MKNQTKICRICNVPMPNDRKVHFMEVKVALGEWDGVEDHADESIFYYMDNEPLEEGTIIAEDFIVVNIYESEV
jgi:hypothetical protein